MKLWLDDVRPMPQGYDRHVRTAAETISAIQEGIFDEVSLDHDLGDGCGTGLEVARWIEEEARAGRLGRLRWRVHSMNPVGKAAMECYLRNADRVWAKREQPSPTLRERPIRRVCLYGGPCGGKTTAARWLASELATKGYNCDYVQEFVKGWAYLGNLPEGYDQLHILGQQVRAEEIPLRGGVDFIVTDSPLMLSVVYSRLYSLDYADALAPMAFHPENHYRSFNIFLDRTNIPFRDHGRFQGYDVAKKVDGMILDVIADFYPIPPVVIDPTDRPALLSVVEAAVGPPPTED